MITIITPCFRQENLPIILKSIQLDKIAKWIIVYDTTKNKKYTHCFKGEPKICELDCDQAGIAGNAQRNHGVNFVKKGFIYFLDDDNIIHPEFWNISDTFDSNYFYTFDQIRNDNMRNILQPSFWKNIDSTNYNSPLGLYTSGYILFGNTIKLKHIDTAMYIVHKKMIKNILWNLHRYDSDGIFICDVFKENINSHKYINKVCSYYNYLVTKGV